MAELINKKDAIAIVNSIPCATLEEECTKSVAVGCIVRLPTTTEAEIREKAIDEFAEKLKAEMSQQIFSDEEKFKYARKEQEAICAQNATWKVAIRLSDYVAEQLKEE